MRERLTIPHRWTEADIPDQAGKIAVVTGGNVGLGHETVKALARKHAHVVIACRDVEKGSAARDRVLQSVPGASIEVMRLDLASLDSIRSFAGEFQARHDRSAGSTSPISWGRSSTTAGSLIAKASWLTYFSLTNCSTGWRRRARPPSAWRRILVSPRPICERSCGRKRRPGSTGYPVSFLNGCLDPAPSRVPCPNCTPPPRPAFEAAITTARMVSSKSAAFPGG